MIYAFINPQATLSRADPTPEQARAAAGLSQLLAQAELIPVTGLDETELLSVPAAFTSWQILRHGAVVIGEDGLEDAPWRRLTLETQRLREDGLRLAHQAATHISQLGQLGLEVTLDGHSGLPLLVRLTHPHRLELALDQAERELRAWLDGGPFQADLRVLRGADRLTLLPRELTPESAVNYVLGQLPPDTMLTVGVSAQPGDAAFLALCDYALLPGESEWLSTAEGAQDDD
ncbi:hypothetical protein [Deinococcus aerophilus]|uniref:Uncharacterized protein n=1 Tax=Deinococcus aerophilus TaxID=522488 RepID=A0ABQ2GJ26_9DEIO|nr:hypothetical protein [Deinococcus aerophilus]GGL98648.1 hypothetical protein GCM10010841_03840 [Deinococcus aerophilus]